MRVLFGLLLLVALSHCEAWADPGVTRGFELLKANCSRCHAIGMDGDSPHREAPPFRVVMKSYSADSLSEALAEG